MTLGVPPAPMSPEGKASEEGVLSTQVAREQDFLQTATRIAA
jgi:hypothetical protein